jgi:hypothetical protein
LVPDEFDLLLQDISNGVKRVVVAIGPGENYDSKFHAVVAPGKNVGTVILAQGSCLGSCSRGLKAGIFHVGAALLPPTISGAPQD